MTDRAEIDHMHERLLLGLDGRAVSKEQSFGLGEVIGDCEELREKVAADVLQPTAMKARR